MSSLSSVYEPDGLTVGNEEQTGFSYRLTRPGLLLINTYCINSSVFMHPNWKHLVLAMPTHCMLALLSLKLVQKNSSFLVSICLDSTSAVGSFLTAANHFSKPIFSLVFVLYFCCSVFLPSRLLPITYLQKTSESWAVCLAFIDHPRLLFVSAFVWVSSQLLSTLRMQGHVRKGCIF